MSKLLVVDDDEAIRRLIRINLSDTYEIVDTGEPEQALALALEHQPDAVLLDLRMPKFSGYQLCETFTSFCNTKTIPFFVVSGEGSASAKDLCRALGASGYFEKPVDFEALRATLAQSVRPREAVRRAEVRVNLRVPVRLSGTDAHGKRFDSVTITENVSISGFLCASSVSLETGAIVDVYLVSGKDNCVGQAQVVRSEATGTSRQRYGFRFTGKIGRWVLE
jgi:CheY-like chemotaxis protein